jgi:hypothetical protein
MKKCDVSHCKKSARYKMFHRASDLHGKIWTDTGLIWNFTGMKLKDENIQAR